MKGAATALGVSETTISRRLQKLPRGNIANLFTRDGQRWLPTRVVSQLINVAETVERQIIEADSIFDERIEGITGDLRISGLSFLNSYIIGPRIIQFQRENPDLKIALEASDEHVSLAYREADVALHLARPSQGRLIGKRIAQIPMAPVERMGAQPDQWVGLPENLDRTSEIQVGFKYFGGSPVLRVDSFEGILQIVEQSDYAGIAPTCIMNRYGKSIRVIGPSVNRELWLTYHEDLRNSPKIRALIKWFSQILPNANKCLCGGCET